MKLEKIVIHGEARDTFNTCYFVSSKLVCDNPPTLADQEVIKDINNYAPTNKLYNNSLVIYQRLK
jgi:hypothetical protein